MDQYESDDTTAEAQAANRFIQSGATEQHTLCKEGKPNFTDIDTVLVQAQAGQTYTLLVTAQSFFPEMSVGIVGQPQIGKWDDCGGDVTRLCVTWTASVTGSYYARISDAQAGAGNPGHRYSLSLFVGTPPTVAAPTATATRSAAAAPPVFGSNPAASNSTGSAQGHGASAAPQASTPPATTTGAVAAGVPSTPTLPALVFGADAAGDQASGLTPRPANTGAAPTTTRGTVAATTQASATTLASSSPSPAATLSTTPQTVAPTTVASLPKPVSTAQLSPSGSSNALIISILTLGGLGLAAGGWGLMNVLVAGAAAKGSAGAGAVAAVKGAKGLKILTFGIKRP